MKANGIILQ